GWRFPNERMKNMFPLEQMGETAENVRERYAISRDAQDRFALASHTRAVAAQAAGRFDDELVPIEVPGEKRGSTVRFDKDEGPRAGPRDEARPGARGVAARRARAGRAQRGLRSAGAGRAA